MSEAGSSDQDEKARQRSRWVDLGPRLASAFVLLPVVAITLYLGSYLFAAVVGLIFAGVYREWETMVARKKLSPAGMAMIALVALSGIAYPLTELVFPTLAPMGTVACIAVAVVVAGGLGGEGIAWRILGLVFCGLVIIGLLAMRGSTIDGVLAGVYLATVVWMTDSAAFFAGRQIGGEKLAPDISPGKTWSGALGGLALGTAAGSALWLIFTDSPWWLGIVFSALISVLGQIGDLTESAIKRRFRIKDSGDIIPGHGGLMDRLDSLTFGALFVFFVGWAHGGFSAIASGFLNW